jgi:hypothetical protein
MKWSLTFGFVPPEVNDGAGDHSLGDGDKHEIAAFTVINGHRARTA